MDKSELCERISRQTDLNKADVMKVVNAAMEEISAALASGENIYLRGFGSFIRKWRAEKLGRNISKKTSVIIPAHWLPAWKPCDAVKERVKRSETTG